VPTWALWATLAAAIWGLAAVLVTLAVGRVSRTAPTDGLGVPVDGAKPRWALELATARRVRDEAEGRETPLPRFGGQPLRVLVVDDDDNLRTLIRTSFEAGDMSVDEADGALAASEKIADSRPDVIVLDVNMPGIDGVTFCRGLKTDPYTSDIAVVLLTGAAEISETESRADGFLRKPFSPLALLAMVERLGSRAVVGGPAPSIEHSADRQLLLYAQDFRRLLDLERGQRLLLQSAYRETAVALAHALEAKDSRTGAHSERVRRYATELARAVDPALPQDPSLEYGFILHDIGKIAIPDALLSKREPLSPAERRVLETHPVLGEQMVGHAALLRGQGASVVRSHHERWDGGGYPDGLVGHEIPLGARIFSIADALDAMTSERSYRPARPWGDAVSEIVSQAGTQFDPDLVDLFRGREDSLRRIYYEISAN
jgi:response regulator RpfG family c-di-GMP phosphodiesterase